MFNIQVRHLLVAASLFILTSCSVQKKIGKAAEENVLGDAALQTAHIGISIFDTETNKYLYNYQGDKYFLPASNIKIPTCYAAMKYLGDSLVGLRYAVLENPQPEKWLLAIDATGDPTFMHKDFKKQPVWDFLESEMLNKQKKPGLLFKNNKVERWGIGWSWNDYDAAYMAERSLFPAYGNVVQIELNDTDKRTYIDTFLTSGKRMMGKIFLTTPSYFDSVINRRVLSTFSNIQSLVPKISIARDIDANRFSVKENDQSFKSTEMPYVTDRGWTALNIVSSQLQNQYSWSIVASTGRPNEYAWDSEDGDIYSFRVKRWHPIHSQPTDSLLKPMMHRSDNFFAEQSLLMVSNEMLGVMNDSKIIDTILKTDFKDLPQKPRWADGSGLSRYNLFTPQSFVVILNKMKNEFGMSRLKEIFPTGGEGTLSSYYKADSSFIYAKTGTLSGVVALSGFMYTAKNKLLLFSVLVNNHQASATAVRRAVEKFLQGIRSKY